MTKREIEPGSSERSPSEIGFMLRAAGRKTGPEILRHLASARGAGGGGEPETRAGSEKPARKRAPNKA